MSLSFRVSGACKLDMVMTGLVFAGAQVLHLLLHHIWAISTRKKIYISFPKACLFTMFEQFQFTKNIFNIYLFFPMACCFTIFEQFQFKKKYLLFFSFFPRPATSPYLSNCILQKHLIFLSLFPCKACPGSPLVVSVGGVPFCPDRDSTSLRECCTEIYSIKIWYFPLKYFSFGETQTMEWWDKALCKISALCDT